MPSQQFRELAFMPRYTTGIDSERSLIPTIGTPAGKLLQEQTAVAKVHAVAGFPTHSVPLHTTLEVRLTCIFLATHPSSNLATIDEGVPVLSGPALERFS